MRKGRRASNLLILALALACAGLGTLAWAELRMEIDDEPIAAVADRTDPVDAVQRTEPFQLPAIASLSEVTERPLFAESRRPPLAPPPAPGQVSRELDSLTLVGVVITPAGGHALIQTEAQAKPERVKLGQSLFGWTIDGILRDRVVFKRGEQREELRVKEPDRPPTSP
jgi:hypothetical protein